MNFGIKSVANIISRANNYLSNACSVQSSESTEAFRSVKRTKDEQLAAEKQIADEEARKIKSATDRARDAISADRNCIDNIVDLNNKLISVDKKYAKRNKAISFAGVSDDLIKQILTALGYKDTPDFEVVKKLYAFYKEKSYRYISKPISPILIASKKRISIYDQLASCLILAQEYIKNNEKYYIDKRDEEIKEIKDDAAQQIINTRKRFEIKMAMLQQNIKSDSEFLVEESSKGIGEIFNDDFYAAFHSVRERAKECFGQVNTDGAFQDEIYIGDIAFNFSDEILSILSVYEDVCKLAVLSGLEIDKAKRAYDNVNVGAELTALRKKYNAPAPIFFQEIDETYRSGEKQYAFYNTTMDYVYNAVKGFHFRKGKAKSKEYEPISRIFGNRTTSDNATDYRHRDKIIEICDEYKARLGRLYMALRSADEKEREVIYERIQDEKAERDSKVSRWLTSINVMLFVIRHYEKNSPSDWRIYAPLINTPLFQKEMLAYPVPEFFIVEDPDGEYCLYGRNFTKTM